MNGTTVVGSGTTPVQLSDFFCPTGVTLDADDRLFIADAYHNRIVVVGPNGILCIPQCSVTSNILNGPRTISFDSHGNIYVSELWNNRIQKFLLMTNSCGKSEIITIN